MTPAIDQFKAWSAPILILMILALAGFVWKQDQDRISSLESQSNATTNALATIQANQSNSLADRNDFQISTTARLNQMADVLQQMGNTLSALKAVQDAERPHIQQQSI